MTASFLLPQLEGAADTVVTLVASLLIAWQGHHRYTFECRRRNCFSEELHSVEAKLLRDVQTARQRRKRRAKKTEHVAKGLRERATERERRKEHTRDEVGSSRRRRAVGGDTDG